MYFHKPQEKPRKWGSFQDVQYAIRKNAEKIYQIDPDSMVLAMPLFWGLPCLDYSGKRNDGVNHGAYYKDGELEFDGSSNYIDCGNDASLNITDAITISSWIKPIETISTYQRIVGDEIYGNGLSFGVKDLNNLDVYTTGSISFSTTDSPLIVGVRQYCVMTFDKDAGAVNGKIYLNGNLIETHSSLNPIPSNSLNSTIGARPGGSLLFNGSINEVRIDKVALTADQIALFHALPYGLYQPVIRRSYCFITGIPVFMHHFNQMRAA